MRIFHELFYRVTGGVMPKDSGTFALMDRRLADELKAMPERGMFLPAQRGWLGFKTASLFLITDPPAWESLNNHTANYLLMRGRGLPVLAFSHCS